jgi:hypothetical protein
MAALNHKIGIMLGSMIETSKMPLLIPDPCPFEKARIFFYGAN